MKMNRLFITSALLLSSLSALGLGVKSETRLTISPYEITELGRGALRASEVTPENVTDSTVVSDRVSRSAVQLRHHKGETNDLVDIRFSAAVNLNIDKNSTPGNVTYNAGGTFGFRILNIKNDGTVGKVADLDVKNYYLSMAGKLNGENVLYCSDYSENTGKNNVTIGTEQYAVKSYDDWFTNSGTPKSNNYDAFIAVSINDIPVLPENMNKTFSVQPYFVTTEGERQLADTIKYSDIEGHKHAVLNVGDKKIPMDYNNNALNGKHERMVTEFNLVKGTKISVENSFGETKYNYIAPRDGKYNFFFNLDNEEIITHAPDMEMGYVVNVGGVDYKTTQSYYKKEQQHIILENVKKGDEFIIFNDKKNRNAVIWPDNPETSFVNKVELKDGKVLAREDMNRLELWYDINVNKISVQTLDDNTYSNFHIVGSVEGQGWKIDDQSEKFKFEKLDDNRLVSKVIKINAGDQFKVFKGITWNSDNFDGKGLHDSPDFECNTGDNNNIKAKVTGNYKVYVNPEGSQIQIVKAE